MDLLTAYNGALLRIGLYLLIFWPTVGYYVYQDTKSEGAHHHISVGLSTGSSGYWD